MILRRWSKSLSLARSWELSSASSSGVRVVGSAFQSVHFAGNQRATAIWQSHENEKDAAPPYTADRRQCPAFKGMMLAGNDHRVGNIAVMGSLWPPPSTPPAVNDFNQHQLINIIYYSITLSILYDNPKTLPLPNFLTSHFLDDVAWPLGQHEARAGDRRRLHHSRLFWVGLFMMLLAIAVYVLSDDLAWRPRLQR